MIEVNSLMVTTSAVRNVSGVEIFNIHVQNMASRIYAYVDFLYPYMDIVSARGFDDSDLARVKEICTDRLDELKEFAYQQKRHDAPIPDDMADVLRQHNVSID